jgi:hypothetical protein
MRAVVMPVLLDDSGRKLVSLIDPVVYKTNDLELAWSSKVSTHYFQLSLHFEKVKKK